MSSKFPRVGSAVLVTNEHGHILLGRRAKDPNRGKWVLPGGKVEPFERIEDAATREIREETGLEIRITGQIGTFDLISPPDEHRVIIFSTAVPVGGELVAASDLSEIRFYSRDEISTLDVSDFIRVVLSQAGWEAHKTGEDPAPVLA